MVGHEESVALGALESLRDTRATGFTSAIARSQLRITSKWALVLSGIYASENEQRYVTRPVAAVHYRSERWHAVLASSYLHQDEPSVDRDAIDTRAELIRFADAAAGLTKLKGKVFRIGHLGDLNDLTLLGTLAGVEMGLACAAVPHRPAGVRAAMDHLASPTEHGTV
jgi:hypothetical protein